MTRSLLFWILFLFWLFFVFAGDWAGWPESPSRRATICNTLLTTLLGLLGWQSYGPAIKA